MAYASWSVVFGEQPSAAKWNILGTNDASFNDGTGIADGAVTAAKRSGGFAVGTFSVSATGNKSITGLGFTPKYVEFDYAKSVGFNNRGGRGCMTATAQYAVGNSTSSGPTSSTDASTSQCLYTQSGGGTVYIVLTYVSMDSDGFTVNATTLASGPHTVGYKAFG